MKISRRKIKNISAFIAALICLFANQTALAQEKKPLNLNDIAVKLTFTSRISKSTKQINKELTADVRKRKVNFILEPDDENLLRKAGANNSLIKAIYESAPKEVKKLEEQTVLYRKHVDNYKGKVEQKKTALDAAKEFVEKYKDCVDAKLIIEYFKQSIPILEQHTTIETQKRF